MKLNDLTLTQLNWAVAQCVGKKRGYAHHLLSIEDLDLVSGVAHSMTQHYRPSTNWAQGGPIMDRENIEVKHHDVYVASIYYRDGIGSDECLFKAVGPTMLVAAMRCFVASKLGEEIEIPKELS